MRRRKPVSWVHDPEPKAWVHSQPIHNPFTLESLTGTRKKYRELFEATSTHLRSYFWPAGYLKYTYSLMGWVFTIQGKPYNKAHVPYSALNVQPSTGLLHSISIVGQICFCYSFCWEKGSSTAHVVMRHCSEWGFSDTENECSWNCFPVFWLFSVDPCLEYWSYHLITVVKDSVFCGSSWGRLSSCARWILWLSCAIYVGSSFCFNTCFFPATHLHGGDILLETELRICYRPYFLSPFC